MTTGAFVRRAVVLELDQTTGGTETLASGTVEAGGRSGDVVKLTLRVSAAHAVALATRARAADTSQGAYVAGLLDGHPPAAVPPNRGEAIAALVASTDQLAALSTDISALIRFLRQGNIRDAGRYRDRLDDLFVETRQHLKQAAELLSAVLPSGQQRGGISAIARRLPRRR